ncbi:MAG: hypothetical protein E7287_09775 [Lachnospiraceae bacterium]|nr:hypothetical protein [Lachnospiraceae bacterium]
MKTNRKIEFFSETVLTILVSIVTLLLQAISFATTWSGSRVYLEGVFPYASLLFATSIQATAYFFSNSLRNKVSALKVTAMLVALCCSTYYSYIGIYNSVNSPERFLQERYVQIERDLTGKYDAESEELMGVIREALSDASTQITANNIRLNKERENIDACREALAEEGKSYVGGMKAPKQSDYENYEDYVAAYNAYVSGRAEGSNAEKETVRKGILENYGFADMAGLQTAEAENTAEMSTLKAALGMTEEQEEVTVQGRVAELYTKLSVAADNAMLGVAFGSTELENLNTLMQAARLCGYDKISYADIMKAVSRVADVAREPLMKNYSELVAALEGGRVTASNTMSLKSSMDAEILSALLKIKLPAGDERYQITDLYLVPVKALQDTGTRMTAFFCLFVATLIDALSLLFAVSLRKRKPLWKRRSLVFTRMEDYIPQIYASLPKEQEAVQVLTDFLKLFEPSPETECDGYIMCAKLQKVRDYYPLVALLCQVNLAKVVSESIFKPESEEGDLLLLRARFVFWLNTEINENRICDRRKKTA